MFLGSRFSILPFQPTPTLTRSVTLHLAGRVVTAVMRHWKPGDSGPDGRCRLCPTCVAYGDGCLIIIGREVARDEAPLLSTHGTRSQENGGVH